VVAVDVRASQTYMMLADLIGKPLSGIVGFDTERDPKELVRTLSRRIRAMLAEGGGIDACEGVGVAVPGMVDLSTMRVLHAPTLGWRNVDLRDPLAAAVGLPVQIENSGRACAIAQLWAMQSGVTPTGDLVFVSVSDGLGVGVVIHGEVLRDGTTSAASSDICRSRSVGSCSCGAHGCWESFVSNRATLARYSDDRSASLFRPPKSISRSAISSRARGDAKARGAILTTGRYLGVGLGVLANVLDPRAFTWGEITTAWDLIEHEMRALGERALTPATAATEVRPVAASEYPRLQERLRS
jgi:predicted NBD/HSP70 family sugar kinase